MTLIVCGGRDYDDYARAKDVLDRYHAKHNVTLVVSGACRLKGPFDLGPNGSPYAWGADGLGERWATENGIEWTRFFAEDYGRWPAAGPKRNGAMGKFAKKDPDGCGCVAFPGGKGTADMIRQAKALGIPGLEIR